MKWVKSAIVGVVLFVALFLLLFPVFAEPARAKDARLLGIDEQPIPNREVVIRSAAGELLGRTRTDVNGRFRFPGEARKAAPPLVDGFTVVRVMGHTGGNPGRSYTYGAPASARFQVVDPEGRYTRLRISVHTYRDGAKEFTSEDKPVIPAGARIDIYPVSEDRRIAQVDREVQNGSVLYRVTLRKLKRQDERQEVWTSPYPGSRSVPKKSSPSPV